MTVVPGFGNRKAKILILGEAPALTEVREGKPFQGRAGEELDNLLRFSGIKKDEVYITNASLQPVNLSGGNKDRFFFTGGKPTPVFIEGLVQLAKDIQEIKPNVVVALGNYALWAMMQHRNILNWRGSILKSKAFNVKVIPTIHPAALLRGSAEEDGGTAKGGGMWKMRSAVIEDFRRVKAHSAYPERRLTPRKVIINPEGADQAEMMAILMGEGDVVFDMETFGKTNLACAGFCLKKDSTKAWVIECDTPERISLLRAILEWEKARKVGHNITGYDILMLDSVGIHTRNFYWDTMVGSHTLFPDLPKSLAFLTSLYTDIPYYKDEGKILRKMRTRQDMIQAMVYCGKDNLSCAEIAQAQEIEMVERGLTPVMDRARLIFGPLRSATATGFKCNIRKLYEFAKSTEIKLKAAQEALNALAGHTVNANSHTQVKNLLYEERGIAKRYKDGKLTSDAHVLSDIAARNGDPAPELVMEVRKEQKRLSNYYNIKILSPDARVRTVHNIAGTKSKRLSTSIPLWGPGLPMQTVPALARSAFIADDGWEILECDQAQAEAVLVAYFANDPIHMDCFRTGKDVHRVTAALLNGMSIEDWQKIPKPSQVRELAKTCNHELNYYAGPFMFMLTVNSEYDPDDPTSVKLDPETAKVLWNRYHMIRPALAGYWESIRKELRDNRMTLKTPLGWEYTFLDKWSDSLLRFAYSLKPQSTVGEATNIGILQCFGLMPPPSTLDMQEGLYYQNRVRESGTKFLAQVHDSATFMVPKDYSEEVSPMLMKLLEVPLHVNGYDIVVPIEANIGPTWYKGDMRSLGVTRKTVEL